MWIVKNEYDLLQQTRPWLHPRDHRGSGKSCTCETLSDDRCIALLNRKLQAVTEHSESGRLKKLADIVKAIHAIMDYKGIPLEEFPRVRSEKLQERGESYRGFY